MYRDDRTQYIVKAHSAVETSKKDIPVGFIMPKALVDAAPEKVDDDADFWNESGDEDDFGASDSSGDDMEMDEDEEDVEEEEDEQEDDE